MAIEAVEAADEAAASIERRSSTTGIAFARIYPACSPSARGKQTSSRRSHTHARGSSTYLALIRLSLLLPELHQFVFVAVVSRLIVRSHHVRGCALRMRIVSHSTSSAAISIRPSVLWEYRARNHLVFVQTRFSCSSAERDEKNTDQRKMTNCVAFDQ